jgi:fluoroquinolone resistance protein
MSFPENSYYHEKFAKISLSNEHLASKLFEECEFNGCTFINCRLEKCRFLNCKFNECIISAVIPVDCRWIEPGFTKCKVMGIDWTKTLELRDPVFKESQINYSSFKLMKLPGIKLINCEAREVDFTHADLSRGDFKNTDFEGSRFFKTDLTDADLKGSKNYLIDVKNNTLKKTRFSYPEVIDLLKSLDIIIE